MDSSLYDILFVGITNLACVIMYISGDQRPWNMTLLSAPFQKIPIFPSLDCKISIADASVM